MSELAQIIIGLTKMIEIIKTCSAPQLAVVRLLFALLLVVLLLRVFAF